MLEDALSVGGRRSRWAWVPSLNPYYAGRCSFSEITGSAAVAVNAVLILIMLEDALSAAIKSPLAKVIQS